MQQIEQIKTIGDAYMAVAGVPVSRADNALVAVGVGLAMLATFDGAIPLKGHSPIHAYLVTQ